MKPRNEFIGGPWDGDVTDARREAISVKGMYYPHLKTVADGTAPDLDRPEYRTIGTYHFKLYRGSQPLRFAYIWTPSA